MKSNNLQLFTQRRITVKKEMHKTSSQEIHIEQRAGKLCLNEIFIRKRVKYFSYPFSFKKNIFKIEAY